MKRRSAFPTGVPRSPFSHLQWFCLLYRVWWASRRDETFGVYVFSGVSIAPRRYRSQQEGNCWRQRPHACACCMTSVTATTHPSIMYYGERIDPAHHCFQKRFSNISRFSHSSNPRDFRCCPRLVTVVTQSPLSFLHIDAKTPSTSISHFNERLKLHHYSYYNSTWI